MRAEFEDDREIRLIELPSPFPLEPGTLRLLEPAEGFNSGHLERLLAGTLGQPFVFDSGAVRHLLFSTDAVQSSMCIDDPDALVAAYTRKMMAFLLFLPKPRHVLMIGLGGGSLAKFCYRHLPQTRISVIEIDAEVISLREHFAIPPDNERFEIIHDDGAAFLARAPLTPDVILVDAFDATGVAPSLASPDFYHRASQSLTPDGVLVMNLSGQKSRYPAAVQSLREAFAGAVVLVPVQADGNVLLFAFKRSQLAEVPEELHDRASELEKSLGLEFRQFLQRLRDGPKLKTRTTRQSK